MTSMAETVEIKEKPVKIKGSMKYVAILAFSAGLAGLLYGYDTVSISGAITYLTAVWNLSASMQGLIISSIMIGGVVGVGVSGFISDRIGRRPVLMIGAICFFVAALWSAVVNDPTSLVWARIIGGLGIGLTSSLSITYITECAPAKYRGTLSSMYQLLTILGIFLTNLINFWIAGIGGIHSSFADSAWRWMLGIGAIPALVLFIALIVMPESPRFLLQKGNRVKGYAILERIGGTDSANQELIEIDASIKENAKGSLKDLFRKPLAHALIIGIFLALFNQWVGQNAISYYGPTIFADIFPGGNTAFLCSTVIGLVELVFTFVGMYFIDRIGRKPLMLSGALGMAVFYLLMGLSMMFNWPGISTLIFACLVIAFFAYSMGPVTWVMISELFPTYMRGRASGICTVFLWGANFLVAEFTPIMFHSMGGGTFIFWAVMDFIAFLGVKFLVPETKGRSLEEIQSFWEK
ncbi:MFS L-arabinose:proton symporter [Bifidobacterium dolichotidis]|uniref:MFS L-arabinose:proton symporter n=1 Tax=Bifidobacterium dolichotidis TaxID=2306976 RepID=A0A430FP09_9BIFI|nr:sugar porter family MFS transporter [Bifidobacterium dolichotidis]RSX54561.1 MFS L-arabinose:proton symporter [Bifidobacterium dolichotidis]